MKLFCFYFFNLNIKYTYVSTECKQYNFLQTFQSLTVATLTTQKSWLAQFSLQFK